MRYRAISRPLLPSLALLVALLVVSVYPPSEPGSATSAEALQDRLAPTPPMGWNSWNAFGCDVTDDLVREAADALVTSGMRDAGYQYVNVDDCWQGTTRTDGHIDPAPDFPDMQALGDYIHARGLKFGLYSDRGTTTCSDRMGSYGYEQIDASDYAAWGVDYLKYDNCSPAPGSDERQDYERMRDALANSGRRIVFSICAWGLEPWMPTAGNLTRTTGDISDTWSSLLANYDVNVALAAYAGPGAWNDPDMLEIGNGGLTDTEDQTHMSLWAIMAAPLIAGNDLRSMTESTRAILTAPEIIAVDQDPLGKQGVKVRDTGDVEVIAKELAGGARAVAILNRGESASTVTVRWTEIGLTAGVAAVRDLWARADLGVFDDSYVLSVPPHGTAMLKVVPRRVRS